MLKEQIGQILRGNDETSQKLKTLVNKELTQSHQQRVAKQALME